MRSWMHGVKPVEEHFKGSNSPRAVPARQRAMMQTAATFIMFVVVENRSCDFSPRPAPVNKKRDQMQMNAKEEQQAVWWPWHCPRTLLRIPGSRWQSLHWNSRQGLRRLKNSNVRVI